MSSITSRQDSLSDITITRHRESGVVEGLLLEGHAPKNRNAAKSEESDLIQSSLAPMKEIDKAETASIDFRQRVSQRFSS